MTDSTRTIQVDALARVEGEGRFKVRLEGGAVVHSEFSIFEPPRYFEALLQGRSFRDAPDVTSRICGICPIAYIMGASQAMEDALGWRIPQPIEDLPVQGPCVLTKGEHGVVRQLRDLSQRQRRRGDMGNQELRAEVACVIRAAMDEAPDDLEAHVFEGG